VLGDHNRSLIHHLSCNNIELLQKILQMPGVEQCFEDTDVKTPIFFNFFGKTPLSIAMKGRDYATFYKLVEFLLSYQDNILNSYLVKDFLVKAIQRNLDIINIMSSNLCISRLTADNVENFDTFPVFHSNDDQVIVNFENSQMELLHDEDAYGHMFGETFPIESIHMESSGSKKTSGRTSPEKMKLEQRKKLED
jgi:hypothetical protein